MDEKPESLAEIWPKEPIPHTDSLYCYVHKSAVNKKDRMPFERAFRNTPFNPGSTNLSSDWSFYSTPEETRQLIGKQKNYKGENKNPDDYFIVALLVGEIYGTFQNQEVLHDPVQNHHELPDNRAHSIIVGEKNERERYDFVKICGWVIEPNWDE